MKAWIDDFNLHVKNEEHLLRLLEAFFRIYSAWNGTCTCQRANENSAPSRVGALVRTNHLSRRIRDGPSAHRMTARNGSVPDCRRIGTVYILLPVDGKRDTGICRAYRTTDRGRRRSLQTLRKANYKVDKGDVVVQLVLGAAQEQAFRSLQDTLQNAVRLAHPNPDKALRVYTDASEKFWSAVFTQIDPKQLSLPIDEQKNEPLAFLGSAFKKPELGWTMYETEGFAIYQAFEKLDYLMLRDQNKHVFTDHRNLLFVFAPLALDPALGNPHFSKVKRWTLFLSRFDYVTEHIDIDGDKNVFADILTRWTKGYRQTPRVMRKLCNLVATSAQIATSPDEISWPEIEHFRRAPRKAENAPTELTKGGDGVLRKGDMIWLPSSALELNLKVLVISHCGCVGRRGQEATEIVVRESFWWKEITHELSSFVTGCLHCILTRTGQLVPRPLTTVLHGSRPNEVVHMDFLFMGASQEGLVYLLIMRDDVSSYAWIWRTNESTSEAEAEALSMWIGTFGTMDWLVNDQASHLKNKLICELTAEFHANHHFTTAYSPWANGSVERVCWEVLRACKTLLSEWRA